MPTHNKVIEFNAGDRLSREMAEATARLNLVDVIARRLENFEGLEAVSQIILAASMADHPTKEFPHLIETALRRRDATVLGQLIIGAVDRWRCDEAEAKSRGI